MRERWKQIEDFPDYVVSNRGRVKRLTPACGTQAGRILKPQRRGGVGGEYHYVDLFRDGKSRSCAVHRIVAEAFLPDFEPALEVNHKRPHKKFDNRVSNLECLTGNANHSLAVKAGLLNKPRSKARHVYLTRSGWRLVVAGIHHGYFKLKQQALAKRKELLATL